MNSIRRFGKNRSYLGNQVVSCGLAFACGALALLSIGISAGPVAFLEWLLRGHGTGFVRVVGFLFMKVFTVAASVTIFFLMYWILPNGKVPARAVLPVAIIMELLSKYAYILALPWLDFREVYGLVRAFGNDDVLGVPVGTVAAGWRPSFGGRVSAQCSVDG